MRNKQHGTVYHYCYSSHIREILTSGVLLPPRLTPHYATRRNSAIREFGEHITQDKGYRADGKLLLFSQRTDWEPASYKGILTNGKVIDLFKLEDYAEFATDVYRIGVSRALLHPWVRLKSMSGMPTDMGRALEDIARNIGSNPYDWWGTMLPATQDKWRSVEAYNPTTKIWEPLAEIPRTKTDSGFLTDNGEAVVCTERVRR